MTPRRGLALAAGIAVFVLLVALVAAAMLMQPRQLARIALGSVGNALGLEIGFEGDARYRLRGTPLLEVRDVTMRQPGATEPLLRAARVLVSLPWSTVRDRAAPLVLERIELDAPVVDIALMQAWLATRPPGDGGLPTLSRGIAVRDGQVLADGWALEGLHLDLPSFAQARPLAAHARGALALAAPTRLHFDLQLAATAPANGAGAAARGRVRLEGAGWQLPAHVAASGPIHFDAGVVGVSPLRFGMSGAYRGTGEPLRLALGLHGPLRLRDGTWTLAPAALALRGEGLVPTLDATGQAGFGSALLLEFDGTMPRWPATWPGLPAPLDDASAPFAFTASYAGARDFSSPLSLRVEQAGTEAEARFRVADVLAWMDAGAAGSPLPPIQARASAPRIEFAGAVLQGVELGIEDGAAE